MTVIDATGMNTNPMRRSAARYARHKTSADKEVRRLLGMTFCSLFLICASAEAGFVCSGIPTDPQQQGFGAISCRHTPVSVRSRRRAR